MTKKFKTIILTAVLLVCLFVLGVMIYLFIPRECEHHFCKKTPFEATCEEKGYTLYECRKCDYTFEADFIAPLGHQFTDTTVAPLCDAEGYTKHLCSVCGVEKIDTYVAPKGHSFSVVEVVAPSCEGQGYTKQKCDDCSMTKNTDYIKPNGHDFSGEKTLPTCTTGGYTSFACANCDHKYVSEYTKPTGHTIGVLNVIESTCTQEGYSVYKCENCTYRYTSDYTLPTGHTIGVLNVIESTCTQEGYSVYKCENCTYQYTSDYTLPTGHTIGAPSVVEPTCTQEGYSIYECAKCDYEYTSDYTPVAEHSVIKKSTVPCGCLTEGYSVFECENCDYGYIGERVAPRGHVMVQSTVAPTCTREGYTSFDCEHCDYKYISNMVAPLEHSYTKTYVRPNIEQTGYTIYKCTSCQSEHEADFVFYSDIFTGSAGEGRGSLAFGLDLSHHSGDVDFVALKNAGVEFVILRVGYNTSLDTRFEEYYALAKEAGLDVGVYFFTLAESKEDAIADAKRVASWLEGKKLEYPVFYDIEDYASYQPSTFSETQLMEIAHTFMTEMVNYGYYPGLYTNNNFLYNLFNSEKTLRLYDVWYARYTAVNDELITEYSGLYSMWQYRGNVEGFAGGAVSGMCDLNYVFKDYPEIMKQFGFNGYQ